MKRVCLLIGLLIVLTGCLCTPEERATTEVMVPIPLPGHLRAVVPLPGETYTAEEYGDLAPSLGWNATTASICFSIFPSKLMESGDFFDSAEWWLSNRVYLVVDNQTTREYHSLVLTDSLGREGIDPATGDIIWKEPDGLHTATIVAGKTSGEKVSYTWQFRITD